MSARRCDRRITVAALVAVTPLVVAGCAGSGSPDPAPTDTAPIVLPSGAEADRAEQRDGQVDPLADLEVEDQSGDGSEIVITSITMSRPSGVVTIQDAAGRLIGATDVTNATQPVTLRLDRPITGTQRLVATLWADDGDSIREPRKEPPLRDDEGEVVSEDFTYVVT